MKESKPTHVMLRVVGHRSRLNRHWRFTARQWRVAIGVSAGVIPLLLALGVYGLLGTIVPRPGDPAQGVRAAAAMRAQVTALTRSTAAGLDVMAMELGVLNTDAGRLAFLEHRLVRATGVAFGRTDSRSGPARFRAVPVSSPDSSRLMARLHALAQRFTPTSASRGRQAL